MILALPHSAPELMRKSSKALQWRPWVPDVSERYVQGIATRIASKDPDEAEQDILSLVSRNRRIHEFECVNLNPATSVMNPRAEAVLSQGLGRPSLGYPGDKYEMGLEAIEQLEVIAAELAAEVFNARFAEVRVLSGAMANLYVFMALARPGDSIIAPSVSIGGHVTHHAAGCAGRYGLVSLPAPVDPQTYSVDINALRAQALKVKPKLITIGGSLNLFPHPVAEIRKVADEVGALVLFDAAHLSGVIAGGAWQNPLEQGAHVMTMSTYKSLCGPTAGLILTNEPEIARALDDVAYPGMTANFNAANCAALALTLLDWKHCGALYAQSMIATARALARALIEREVPVFAHDRGATTSHQFAINASAFGGGHAAAKLLRKCNILTCAIGLPLNSGGSDPDGLRAGSPEIVRWGMTPDDMPQLASFIQQGLTGARSLADIATEVSAFRQQFTTLHFVRP